MSLLTLGQDGLMLRKIIWTSLYAGFTAVAAAVTRRSASLIWRTLTGEEPPVKK